MTTPLEAWDPIAPGYDEFATPVITPMAEIALDRVELRSGTRLLDVAAGTGALSLPAARRGAEVVATDISPSMIERLKWRAHREGLSNVDARVMDGQDLEFEDDTFDVGASQNGVSLFPDLKRGLSELVRVTRPGGQVLIVAFGPPQKAEFFGLFLGAMKATVPGFTGPPTDPPPLPFQVADPERLHQAFAEAGLTAITVDTVEFGMELPSPTHLWGLVLNSNPMGAAMVAGLTEEQRAEVRRVLEGMASERSDRDGRVVLHADVNVGIGTKGVER